MAKPDLDDGYLKVAHELDAALACAGFGRDERIVLHEVFEMIFGPAKRKTFDLSPSLIGERYGLPKQAIGRAITLLTEAGVIVRTRFVFRFVKDYERWTWKGKPMLSPAMIQACRKAPKRAKSDVIKFVDGSENTGSTNSLTDKAKASSKLLTDKQTPCMDVNKFDDAASTNLLTQNSNGHYVEPARLIPRENREESKRGTLARGLNFSETGREGEDHELFVKVVGELEAYEPTAFLADALIEANETPSMRNIPSWRMFVACRTVQRPDKSKTWGLFRSVALNCTFAEYQRLSKTPTANGTKATGFGPTNQPTEIPADSLSKYQAEADDAAAKYGRSPAEYREKVKRGELPKV